jgi:L-lactate dehydrogenase (cytochrome)
MSLASIIDIAGKPRWWRGMLGTRRRTFGNIVGHAPGVKDTRALASWTAEQFDPTLNWDDVKRIKDEWGGKLIVKGVMDAEDAELAVASGADALIVSNHGGRQLDGTVSSIAALPAIDAAVGSRIEVFMDGGVRGGQDVLKALALGAKAVFIGRAYIYGLGAMGQAGVAKALECIRRELDVSMALCGLTDVRQAGAHTLVRHG